MLFLIASLDFSKTRKSGQNLSNMANIQNAVMRFQVSASSAANCLILLFMSVICTYICTNSNNTPIVLACEQPDFYLPLVSPHVDKRNISDCGVVIKEAETILYCSDLDMSYTLVLASICTPDDLHHHLIQSHASCPLYPFRLLQFFPTLGLLCSKTTAQANGSRNRDSGQFSPVILPTWFCCYLKES